MPFYNLETNPIEFFVQVYYNGHVERTNTEGIVFSCENSSLLKVKKNIKLDGLIQRIQKTIQPDNSKRVTDLIYRYPMTLAQGLVRYESLLLSRDDEVGMMFEMFKTCKHLGISVIEIYASLVDAPYDETQVEPSYTQPTPLSYPLFETQTSHHSIPSSSTNHPSESTHNIDLNSPYRLNISNDVAPISVVASVHNEEVGDFSEHEDDIAAQHVDNDDEDQEIFFSEPPSHFRSVTSGDMEYVDNEFIHSMSRNQSYLVPDPDNLQEGMRFPTKELAIQCIREYHLNKAPDFVVTHSDSKRWIVQCANESCMWRCRVICSKKSHVWQITKLEGPHTCASTVVSQDHHQLSSSFICESILQMVKEDPTISVSVLIAHIRSRYTYTTTYRKTWIAKQKAIERIYGNWEKSYNELAPWLRAFEYYLPGTITDIEAFPYIKDGQVDPRKGIFKRIFWSFKPCINAFAYCKPVLSVDGTWLYGKYRGTLLIAIAQDGRNNIIPIAYALVEGETADAWLFFLQRLRMLVAAYPDLCLISDRHESIKSAVRRLNTDWHHVFCIRHISQNFMRTFKNADMRKIVTNMG
jgi:hypothetical protein